MSDSPSILDKFTQVIQNMGSQLSDFLPQLLMAAAVLFVGWAIATLLRMVIVGSSSKLDHYWHRFAAKEALQPLQFRNPPTIIIGEFIFWVVIVASLVLAAEALGFKSFSTLLTGMLSYLPLAIGGIFVVLIGFVIGSLANNLITSAAISAGLEHGEMLGRTSQFIIISIAVIVGIDQIGFHVEFLALIIGIVMATFLGGLSLAFGLGAKTHVSNIIAANQLRSLYRAGDIVSVNDIKGRIIEITVSRVVIESDIGTVDIPAKIFDEQITMIIEKGD